jgi:glycosyltransferase involved in cell wall biosynthesis
MNVKKKLLRIGFDATALPPNPVGAGTYTIELVRALIDIAPQYQWVIFAQPTGKELLALPEDPALEWVIASEKPPFLRLLWEQTVLPLLAKQTRLDILHSPHYTRPLLLPCASVVTFHDMTFFLLPQVHTHAKRLFFPAAIRFSARFADALIAVSENTRQDAIRLLNIPQNKIHTTPNGISSAFQPIKDVELQRICQKKYGLPDKFILFVGTIEPRKNLPILLQAYRQLLDLSAGLSLQPYEPPPLVIVGKMGWMMDGKEHRPELHQIINQLDLTERVLLTGYISAEDLPIVYNLANIFVYPSIYEGFGLPPLEAMACGTPVITTDSSAMAETVGDAAILTPPNDAQALAQAMYSLLRDENLQTKLSHKGRSQAARFNWQRTAQLTLKVYQQLIEA